MMFQSRTKCGNFENLLHQNGEMQLFQSETKLISKWGNYFNAGHNNCIMI